MAELNPIGNRFLITFSVWRSWRDFRGLGERFRDLKYDSVIYGTMMIVPIMGW